MCFYYRLSSRKTFLYFFNKVFSFICYYLAVDNYALLFPRKGTSDYVITRGMPNLKAVTFCLWMKTADKGNVAVPLSYAVPGSDNEITLGGSKFDIWIGASYR